MRLKTNLLTGSKFGKANPSQHSHNTWTKAGQFIRKTALVSTFTETPLQKPNHLHLASYTIAKEHLLFQHMRSTSIFDAGCALNRMENPSSRFQ